MNQVLLSDVCEINPRMDSSISDDTECSFVPMEYVDDVSGTIVQTDIRRVGDVKKGYTFFRNGDVIFAKITPCMENGKCAVGKNLKNGIAFGSTEFHVIRAKDEIIPEWIYYYLRQEHVRQSATHWFRGTAGQQRVPAIFLEELKIPLPPLEEQKQIASLLARADRLRGLRRAARRLADSLLQSVFLEMFGEPVNSKKWEVEKLEGFTTLISSGSTPLGGANVYKSSGIRFIRSQNVLMNKLDFSDIAFISEEIHNSMKRTVVKQNDVLLNITGASIGRVACYQDDIPANVNQHVCIIRCKPEKLNPIYLSYVISMPSFQEQILANQSGATRQALTFEQIREFKIPVPPLPLQEEFARVAARVEGLRARQAEAERQAEGLFQSLLALSFTEGLAQSFGE